MTKRPRFKSSHSTRRIKLRASCSSRIEETKPAHSWRNEDQEPRFPSKKKHGMNRGKRDR